MLRPGEVTPSQSDQGYNHMFWLFINPKGTFLSQVPNNSNSVQNQLFPTLMSLVQLIVHLKKVHPKRCERNKVESLVMKILVVFEVLRAFVILVTRLVQHQQFSTTSSTWYGAQIMSRGFDVKTGSLLLAE